jgi:integrase
MGMQREICQAMIGIAGSEIIKHKEGQFVTGPFIDMKRIMKTLCKKAGAKYFRFHALRHSGASIMDSSNVLIGSIQRILGYENRSTTENYLHSIGEAGRLAIAVFEKVQQNSHTDSHTETH